MADIHSRYADVEKLIDDEQYEAAIPELQLILAEDESFVLGHLALARCCTKVGQHEEAIAHGVKATELEPTDAFNFTALSVTYQRAWAGTQNQAYIGAAEDAMARASQLA